QGQTELSQPLCKGFPSAESVRAILETQHEVVDISHHAGLAPKPGLDHALEPQIEHIVQIHVTQQNADRPALRGSLFARMNFTILKHTCLQPAPNQTDQALISHPVLHEAEHPFVTQAPEEIFEVRLPHPLDFAPGDPLVKSRQGLVGASAGPSAERAWKKILLVDGRQHLRGTSLKRPVCYGGHAQRAHLLLSGLRDIDTPYIRRSISLSVDGLQHGCNPLLKTLFRFGYGLSIHSGCGLVRNLTEILPDPLLRDVMGQRRKPELRLAPGFVCYSFESCCHDWRFFSLHRRPNPPFEWSSCFPRTIQLPLPASPCSRLSRPRSTIRQSDFHQVIRSSSLMKLVRPYKPGLNPTALP